MVQSVTTPGEELRRTNADPMGDRRHARARLASSLFLPMMAVLPRLFQTQTIRLERQSLRPLE
ncbi:hypothetical protein NXT3_PB00320 (plasmid) [Sinorhizobium fredii]|uniref:Uncharacterized protein n=1 Tax=Rhizobium fredii TaxID=380 RepID=A0A2L0HBY5_RHIFR|nr:hypothetical protein NXT3_PB00320 [Sinorhizobium fredii]